MFISMLNSLFSGFAHQNIFNLPVSELTPFTAVLYFATEILTLC